MGKTLLAMIIGYFIGNLSSSYFIGKAMRNIDIREHGSGNAGTTNTFRVLGAPAGAIVFLCDVLKGALAAWIGLKLTGTELGAVLAGGMAVIGHNWPVFLKFRGGKGIASSLGMILALYPKIGLIILAAAMVLILATRYVSLGSISGAVLFPVLLAVYREPPGIILVGAILAVIALYRHKGNIKRLLNGQENKFSFSGSGRQK